MKSRQLHIVRLQPESDPRAPLVEVYNLLHDPGTTSASHKIGVLRYAEDMEHQEIEQLLEGVEAALDDGVSPAISVMALDSTLAFEVYELDDEAMDDGDSTTALVRARSEHLRLRNLEAAREAGWAARVGGAPEAPQLPFAEGELAVRWADGWTAADMRIDHGVQQDQLARWKDASLEVCARRAWTALCVANARGPGESALAPWDQLSEEDRQSWRQNVRAWIDATSDYCPSEQLAPAFKAARAIAETYRSFKVDF